MKPADLPGLRRALGVTQAQLGAMLGVHEQTVSKWERGEARPTPYNVQQISGVLRALPHVTPNAIDATRQLIAEGRYVVALARLVLAGEATASPSPEAPTPPSPR